MTVKGETFRTTRIGVLIRPAIIKNECRQSYLQRVAKENGMNGIPDLCRSLQTTYSVLMACPSEWVGPVLAGVHPPKSLLRPTMGDGYYSYGRSTRSRICPLCIQENLPIPPDQNFSLAIRCPHHSIMLVDECPSCATPLSYMRREIAKCDCGYLLRDAPGRSSETWVNIFYSIFAPWRLGTASHTEEQWATNEFRSVSILSLMLKETGTEMECLWLRSTDWEACSKIASTWHTHGRNILLKIWESEDRKSRHRINNNLKNLDTPLLLSSICDTRKQVHEAAKAGYREKMLVRLFPEKIAAEEYGTPSEIRKLAKLDANAVRMLLESGLLGPVAEASDGRVVFRRFPTEYLLKLRTLWLNTLSLDDAASQIGCDRFLLLDLAHCGLVNAHLIEVKPRAPRFSLHDLHRFIAALKSRALSLPEGQIEYVLLEVFPARTGNGNRKKLWGKVVSCIKTGLLPLYTVPSSRTRSYWEVGVLVSDLRRLGTSEKVLDSLVQRTYERHFSCS